MQGVYYFPKEYCGLFGVYGTDRASFYTFLGLYSLQHRGEESCGIVSSNGREFFMHKGMGLVSEVFNEEVISKLRGHICVGHVRYSTTGSSHIKNAQPLFVDYIKGSLAIAHNGNITNSSQLRRRLEESGSIFQTTSDSEILLHLMVKSRKDSFLERLISGISRLKGAYTFLVMKEDMLVGVRDPLGFRPLCIGKKDDVYFLSSESCALDLIGARFLREVEPGEVVFIDKDGLHSLKPFRVPKRKAFCVFEHVYFSRPDSLIFGENVHLIRKKLGSKLAQEMPARADVVIPVPDSGSSAALGFSQESGIPLEMGIIRNHYIGRTFIQPHQEVRDLGVKIKFNILKEVIKGKRIVIVDDSIVRGTTSQKRIRQFRELGAKEVHLRISCPPHRFPCFYGIDFPSKEELIANRYTLEGIRKFLDADSLGYLSLEGMLSCLKHPAHFYCTACWNGDYPVKFKESNKFILEKR